MRAGGEARPFISGPSFESHPALSPDGRWLAYASDESGRPEVYLTDFPAHGGRWQISTDGGTAPAWAPHGSTLYFQKTQFANLSDQLLMSVAIDAVAGAPSVSPPVEALRGPFQLSNEYGRQYDVAPDGTRFLMARRSGLDAPLDLLTVVLNWTQELPRR
jgi:hypothetical protein